MQNSEANSLKRKYVMYLGTLENQMKLVFDSRDLYEESLLNMSENYLKNIFERLFILNTAKKNVSQRKERLVKIASIIFEKQINTIEEVADLLQIKVKKGTDQVEDRESMSTVLCPFAIKYPPLFNNPFFEAK